MMCKSNTVIHVFCLKFIMYLLKFSYKKTRMFAGFEILSDTTIHHPIITSATTKLCLGLNCTLFLILYVS